jgi:putative NADH-flavin reductase
VTITGSIVDDTGDGLLMRRLVKPLARRTFLRAVCADMRITEDEIHASPLDWTIVRPPRLTDKAPTGRYRVGLNQNLHHGTTIPRPDLATCVLALVDDPAMIHEHVFVAT